MSIEKYTFLQIALVLAALNWVIGVIRLEFIDKITKPAVMIALLAFIWNLRAGFILNGKVNWLLFAIIFSLLGELVQILPGDRFIPKLFALILANVAYILVLASGLPPLNLASAAIIVIIAITIYQIYPHISNGLKNLGQQTLKIPILTHLASISLMSIFALFTLVSNSWENYRSLLVSAGSLSLLISSIWLIWDRVVRPLQFGRLRVTTSFHLAHCLLCLGFLMTF